MAAKSSLPLDIPVASLLPSYGAVTVTIDGEGEREEDDFEPLIEDLEKDNYSPVCRDVPFVTLFYCHLAIFLWLGTDVAPKGFDEISLNFTAIEDEMRQSDSFTEEQVTQLVEFATEAFKYMEVYPSRILGTVVAPCAVFAFFISLFIVVFLFRPFPRTMVYACLIESFILMALVLIAGSIVFQSFFLSTLTAFSLVGVAYYVYIAWRMVPFAAVNLKVAVEGVSQNCGLFLVAFVFIKIGIIWAIYWFYVVIGLSWYKSTQCEELHPGSNFDIDSDDYDSVCDPPFLVVLLLLLSLYWTTAITMNLVQITVAGVVGTWCYAKEDASQCCSFAIWTSVVRSLTYSFGSVCMGSLLQAMVRMLRFLVEQARNQRERTDSCDGCGSFLLCIFECIASLLEDFVYIFNQYAYIYAGIYGLSYIDSGRKVMDLFRARGWTTIITNNLVGYVLSYTVFAVGLTTGAIGWATERIVTKYMEPTNDTESFAFGPIPHPGAWGFAIGCLMGVWVCTIMMNVVKGAVNTILVCWADSPTIFEMNHPDLCKDMAESWTNVFPEITVYTGHV